MAARKAKLGARSPEENHDRFRPDAEYPGIDAAARIKLEQFGRLLAGVAAARGFVGETTVPDLGELHLADSLAALPLLDDLRPRGGCILLADVGSGAGLPGIPLRIARPNIELLLLEARRRRCRFLCEAVETLGLDNTTVEGMRAEDAGRDSRYRDGFHVVTARATKVHLRKEDID